VIALPATVVIVACALANDASQATIASSAAVMRGVIGESPGDARWGCLRASAEARQLAALRQQPHAACRRTIIA